MRLAWATLGKILSQKKTERKDPCCLTQSVSSGAGRFKSAFAASVYHFLPPLGPVLALDAASIVSTSYRSLLVCPAHSLFPVFFQVLSYFVFRNIIALQIRCFSG